MSLVIKYSVFKGVPVDDKLVKLTVVNNIFEADLIKGKLESEGIQCYIPDEHTFTANPLHAGAIGNLRIDVNVKDYDNATKILNDYNIKDSVKNESNDNIHENGIKDGTIKCPNCFSNNVIRERYSKKYAYLTILLLGFPVLFRTKKCKCYDCNELWTEKIPLPVFIFRILFVIFVISIVLIILSNIL